VTAAFFLALAALLTTGLLIASWLYLPRRGFAVVMVGLPLWLAYVGALSASGLIRDPGLRPPGIVYVFLPVVLFMVAFAVRSKAGALVASRVPVVLLIGAQSFRVAVELGLHRLGNEGLVPSLMTYEGGNLDIFIGLSAPIVAWLVASGRMGRRAALAWNVVGLLALANVAMRAVLTAPGPLHLWPSDVPNVAIGFFPYTYLAGFFAPLAVLLHILSIRALRSSPDMGLRIAAAGGNA
jgi:hypothetical protein